MGMCGHASEAAGTTSTCVVAKSQSQYWADQERVKMLLTFPCILVTNVTVTIALCVCMCMCVCVCVWGGGGGGGGGGGEGAGNSILMNS